MYVWQQAVGLTKGETIRSFKQTFKWLVVHDHGSNRRWLRLEQLRAPAEELLGEVMAEGFGQGFFERGA